MKKNRLQNISGAIFDRLQRGKDIREDQVYIFLDGVIDSIDSIEKGTEAKEYGELRRYIKEIWQYRELDDFTKESSFLLGGLWGSMTLAKMRKERIAADSAIDQLINRHREHYWFFYAIANTPGINHKNLARRGKKSTSELSQFVARIQKEELISYNRIGREKYYYLQERGKRVYEGLKLARRVEQSFYDKSIKQVAENNDSADKEIMQFYKQINVREKGIPHNFPTFVLGVDNEEQKRVIPHTFINMEENKSLKVYAGSKPGMMRRKGELCKNV